MKKKLIEQYGVPTIYVDDFEDHQIINGVMHCVGYREQRIGADTIGIIEVRLIINLKGLPGAIARTQAALESKVAIEPDCETVAIH